MRLLIGYVALVVCGFSIAAMIFVPRIRIYRERGDKWLGEACDARTELAAEKYERHRVCMNAYANGVEMGTSLHKRPIAHPLGHPVSYSSLDELVPKVLE